MGIFPKSMDRLEKLMEQDMKEALTQAAMQGIGLAAHTPIGLQAGAVHAINSPGSRNVYYDAQRDVYIDMSSGRSWSSDQARPPIAMPHTLESHASREAMLQMRLRNGWQYQHLTTAYVGDKVFVFVVQNDQAVILEDDATMFPSDQLVTQLRLIGK